MSANLACDPAGTIVHLIARVPAVGAGLCVAVGLGVTQLPPNSSSRDICPGGANYVRISDQCCPNIDPKDPSQICVRKLK